MSPSPTNHQPYDMESCDDSLLEKGNRSSKDERRILFWGGSREENAIFNQKRWELKDGAMVEKMVAKRANPSAAVQHLLNKWLAQTLAARRPEPRVSRAAQASIDDKQALRAKLRDEVLKGLDEWADEAGG